MYRILHAKSDYVEGPKPKIITSIAYEQEGETRWLTNLEYNGRPNFYLTEEDIYDQCFSLEEPYDALKEHRIQDFDGFPLTEDYEGLLPSLEKLSEKQSAGWLILYLVLLTRSDFESLEELIEMSLGKDIAELDFTGIDLYMLF